MWRRKHNFFRIVPSPNGEYFLGFADPECGECPILLMHNNGEYKELEIPNDGPVDFSEDGNSILGMSNDYVAKQGSVILYPHGEKKFNKILGEACSSAKIYKNTIITFCGPLNGDGYLFGLNFQGTILWKIEVAKPRYVYELSKDMDYLIAASEWNHIYFVQFKTGEVIWKFSSGDQNQMFRKIQATPDFSFILAWELNHREGNPNYLYLFNRKGNLLWQKDIKIRNMWISQDGKEIKIITDTGELKIFNNPYVK